MVIKKYKKVTKKCEKKLKNELERDATPQEGAATRKTMGTKGRRRRRDAAATARRTRRSGPPARCTVAVASARSISVAGVAGRRQQHDATRTTGGDGTRSGDYRQFEWPPLNFMKKKLLKSGTLKFKKKVNLQPRETPGATFVFAGTTTLRSIATPAALD